jgi:hypothetical protein
MNNTRNQNLLDDGLCRSGGEKETGQGEAKPRVRGRFRGMVLEKLNGSTLASILGSKRSGVQDVHYLRQALLQVSHPVQQVELQQLDHHSLCSYQFC